MNDSINVSGWFVDLSDTAAGHAYEGRQMELLSTQDILDICGAMDVNGLVAASLGVVVTLAYLFFVRRFRDRLSSVHVLVLDKGFLTLIALLFVIVIVRFARAG